MFGFRSPTQKAINSSTEEKDCSVSTIREPPRSSRVTTTHRPTIAGRMPSTLSVGFVSYEKRDGESGTPLRSLSSTHCLTRV